MSGKTEPTIRPATIQDVPVIVAMMHDLADYHHAKDLFFTTSDMLRSALFETESVLRCIVAERAPDIIGYALFYFNFSSWTGRKGIYLEDLYVRPEKRGGKTGHTLIERIAQIAVAADCARLEWRVANWNKAAASFYARLGAEPQVDATLYRLDEEALLRLTQN